MSLRGCCIGLIAAVAMAGCKEENSAPVIDEQKLIEESKQDQKDALKGKRLSGS